MTTERPWPAALTDVTAAQVRRYRERRKLTTKQFADEVTAFGLKYSRDQVVNLERQTRRTTITVGEVIAFAAVLGVPPVFLLTPVGEEDAVEYRPGRTIDAWHAYGWFTGLGIGSETLTDDIAEQDFDVVRKFNVYRRHDTAVMNLDRDMHYVDSDDEDDAIRQQRARDIHLADLVAIRDEIRNADWAPPALPLSVKRIVEAVESRKAQR